MLLISFLDWILKQKRAETQHIFEVFKHFYCCDQMRCLSRGASGSKSRTPLVAEQKGFPGECPTISKQSPGWISSLALKPHWRVRIWVAHEKMKFCAMKPHVSNLKMLKNESVSLEIVHKQNVSRALEKGMKENDKDAFMIHPLLLPKLDSQLYDVTCPVILCLSLKPVKGQLFKICFTSSPLIHILLSWSVFLLLSLWHV